MAEARQAKPFKVRGIELVTFSIQPQPAREYSGSISEFTIYQEQKTNAEKKLIIVFTTVTIRKTGKGTPLAHLQVACGFEIPSFESIIKKNKEGDYLIPHELNANINRIAIATTRGVLYSQLRGSYLQNLTLPVLAIE